MERGCDCQNLLSLNIFGNAYSSPNSSPFQYRDTLSVSVLLLSVSPRLSPAPSQLDWGNSGALCTPRTVGLVAATRGEGGEEEGVCLWAGRGEWGSLSALMT